MRALGPEGQEYQKRAVGDEGKSVAFLSQARNSQETAAFAAVFKEIKLKVRRLDSRYYMAARAISQPD